MSYAAPSAYRHPANRRKHAASASATVRQTLVFERVAGSAARWQSQSRFSTIRSSAAALASERALRPVSPPNPLAHSSVQIASSTASIDGVLIVSPLNTPSTSLPFDIRRKTLGSGQEGVYSSSRWTARGPRISTPCPPSPPSTFCHEKVATSILSHGMS